MLIVYVCCDVLCYRSPFLSQQGRSALVWAILSNKEAIALLLIDCPRVNVNLRDLTGYTALIAAAAQNLLTVVERLLLREDLDVNQSDEEGLTALMTAVSSLDDPAGSIAIALITDPRTEVNAVTNDGWTALMAAAERGKTAVVRALLSRDHLDVNLTQNVSPGATCALRSMTVYLCIYGV